MSKCDNRPHFECQNKILNVKIRYSARIQMSNLDFECQNAIFGPISNVKIGFKYQNAIFGPCSNVKIGFQMSKFGIRSHFEYQRRISNVKMRYSARIPMSIQDFECQNSIFGPNSNVKIGF